MSNATGPVSFGSNGDKAEGGKLLRYAMAASAQAWHGAAAAIVIGTGLATPLTFNSSTQAFIGMWGESVLSSSTSGATFTTIQRTGCFPFNISGTAPTAANLLQPMYFTDDNTVSLAPGTMYAGKLVSIDDQGVVWVLIDDATTVSSGAKKQVLTAAILNTNVSGAAQTFATQTVQPGLLAAGTRVRLRGELIGTTRTSTDTCALLLKMGSTTIATLPSAFAHATTNFLTFDFELVILTAGTGGTMVGTGYYGAGTAGATFQALDLASTAVNTTIAEAFTIVGTFSASNTTDQITVNIFDLDVL